MLLYSLSPGAYDGLRRLAQDSRWCPDYDRILRYLDVVVSRKEAARLTAASNALPSHPLDWKQVVFLETAGVAITAPAATRR